MTKQDIVMVATGSVQGGSTKTLHGWCWVDEPGQPALDPEEYSPRSVGPPEGKQLFFPPVRRLPYRPGAVYRFEATETPGGVALVNAEQAEYLGLWPDRDWVDQKRVEHDAEESHLRGLRARNREVLAPCHKEGLDPFRAAYAQASPARRAQMLALAVRYITGGK